MLASGLPLVAAPSVSEFSWVSDSVEVYGKAEATFSLDQSYDNPFDPQEIKVDAVVSGPGGIEYEIPAFWYQKAVWPDAELGEFVNISLEGEEIWMLRFTPRQAGQWSVRLRVEDASGTSLSESYSVAASGGGERGFVRLDEKEQIGYRFDDGSPYLPLGFNLSWNDHSLNGFYRTYLDAMAENGVNWLRHWMTPFQRQALEWDPGHWSNVYPGLGLYSQEAAAITDLVLEMSNERNIYVQIALEQHGMYSINADSMWADNPYNSANGGPAATPTEFFTDDASISLVKNRYRYVVARWGYSQNIFAWELFNEANWIEVADSIKGDWHTTMANYLKELDPYNHLVTTSRCSFASKRLRRRHRYNVAAQRGSALSCRRFLKRPWKFRLVTPVAIGHGELEVATVQRRLDVPSAMVEITKLELLERNTVRNLY